jgi:hypothetical protein
MTGGNLELPGAEEVHSSKSLERLVFERVFGFSLFPVDTPQSHPIITQSYP